MSRKRLWMFRLAAMIAAPLLVAVVLEVALRIAGYGYSSGFLLTGEKNGEATFYPNPRFGWKHFGKQLARSPVPFAIGKQKPENTVRVFVFGESAANGDPEPDYGLPRMLEAVLELRYPQTKFEVVNAAITGINSHAVREIARDSVNAGGDVWVIYMGNNEVVGPYGAGTVFGPQTPALPLIRASLAIKSLRMGQLLGSLIGSMSGSESGDKQWGGMTMFTKNQVARDDPRMEKVYHHFERNLDEILGFARDRGIKTVVSTVAVNLSDSAPFASGWSSKTLTAGQKMAWDQHAKEGSGLFARNQFDSAILEFNKAAEIDRNVSELQYLMGRALLGKNDPSAALVHFESARDLDLLRFRCDSHLNSIIRKLAENPQGGADAFVDAATELNSLSPGGIAGEAFFLEHVHLTLAGNYQLAKLLARGVEDSMAAVLPPPTEQLWPTLEECAARLAWTPLAEQGTLVKILGRLNEAPFTDQISHSRQLRAIRKSLTELANQPKDQQLSKSLEIVRSAVEKCPEDASLRSQLALLLTQDGKLDAALGEAQKAAELMPFSVSKKFQLALVLKALGRDKEELKTLQDALSTAPDDVWMLNEMGAARERMGDAQGAKEAYRAAIEANPKFGPGYLALGQILESEGNNSEADGNYRKAAANPVNSLDSLKSMALFFHKHGRFAEGAELYGKALAMDALDPSLHLGAAQCLTALGQVREANVHFTAFSQLDRGSPESIFLQGLDFARAGKLDEAVRKFSEALRIKPDFLEAQLNLAISLRNAGQVGEAIGAYRKALDIQPGNEIAAKGIAELSGPAAGQKSE